MVARDLAIAFGFTDLVFDNSYRLLRTATCMSAHGSGNKKKKHTHTHDKSHYYLAVGTHMKRIIYIFGDFDEFASGWAKHLYPNIFFASARKPHLTLLSVACGVEGGCETNQLHEKSMIFFSYWQMEQQRNSDDYLFLVSGFEHSFYVSSSSVCWSEA